MAKFQSRESIYSALWCIGGISRYFLQPWMIFTVGIYMYITSQNSHWQHPRLWNMTIFNHINYQSYEKGKEMHAQWNLINRNPRVKPLRVVSSYPYQQYKVDWNFRRVPINRDFLCCKRDSTVIIGWAHKEIAVTPLAGHGIIYLLLKGSGNCRAVKYLQEYCPLTLQIHMYM